MPGHSQTSMDTGNTSHSGMKNVLEVSETSILEGLSDDSVVDKDYVPDNDQSSSEDDDFDEINLIAKTRSNVTAESTTIDNQRNIVSQLSID